MQVVSPLEAMSGPNEATGRRRSSRVSVSARTRKSSSAASSSSLFGDDDFSGGGADDDDFSSAGSSVGGDDDANGSLMNNLFASLDNVTIETLKSRLSLLPEGQSCDLTALLRAAKIDLTLDDIVLPPLTQVKRTMEARGLSDWQVQLCIKIRRRKKNTVRTLTLGMISFLNPESYIWLPS